jgi:hypothetical protein
VTLCAVCTIYEETRNTDFLVEPQNQAAYNLLVVHSHTVSFPGPWIRVPLAILVGQHLDSSPAQSHFLMHQFSLTKPSSSPRSSSSIFAKGALQGPHFPASELTAGLRGVISTPVTVSSGLRRQQRAAFARGFQSA